MAPIFSFPWGQRVRRCCDGNMARQLFKSIFIEYVYGIFISSLIPRPEILVKTLCGLYSKLQSGICKRNCKNKLWASLHQISNAAFVNLYHSFPKWIPAFSPCPSGTRSAATETVLKKCFFLRQGSETLPGGVVYGNCGRKVPLIV